MADDSDIGTINLPPSAALRTSKTDSGELLPDFKMIKPHLRASHQLIKLHRWSEVSKDGEWGKIPLRGWREVAPLAEKEVEAHMERGGNIGVRLQALDLVVDVDPRNFPEGRNSFREMCNALNIDPQSWPHVHTGGGGFHYYLRKPADFMIRGELKDFPGVEFKTEGSQVLAAGSVHPKTKAYYTVDFLEDAIYEPAAAPDTLLEAIKRTPRASSPVGGGIPSPLLTELLEPLDPADYRDQAEWLNLMMAAHHATGGGGVEEFIAWSTSDPEYADNGPVIRRRWESLDARRSGGITVATLYKALADAGRHDLVQRANAASAAGDFAEDAELPEPVRAARRVVTDEWVWVAGASRFIRRWDLTKFNKDQWKSMFAHLKPDGDVLTAVWKGAIPLRKFESLVYLPAAAEILSRDGKDQYNLWRPSGVDARPGDTSWFVEHMSYLFPNEDERELVFDYLSILVQKPDQKLHFALLIRGDQGTGKSAIGEMMRRIIGERNVVKPSNEEVMKSFSAWQESAQLAIIEELMMVGRLDLANKLKPVITDPVLRIEEKFGTPYSIPNHLNLLCFTNHRDALRIETGDRRWMVIFSPAKPRTEDYYHRLFSKIASEEGAGAVKQLLLDRAVRLNPKGTAPQTRAKEEMRRLSMSEVEAGLWELFETGERPFDFDLVRQEDILAVIPSDVARKQRNVGALVSKFLQDEIKAVQHTRYTGSGRPNYRLWSVRNHSDWEKIGASARVDAYVAHSKADPSSET